MASNNIILAVPSANSSVNYDLPQSESAKLSFTPEDIDGLKMDANGGLVISFVEGGNVTLTNFKSFIDNGNTLSLADGTQVDPKLLFNALGGTNDNPFPADDVIKIGIPGENSQRDIALEPGQKYLFNFDLSQTTGADVKDGKMVIGFDNGSKIVITNYETAMADKTPPELSLASKTCIVEGDQLITNIQELAKTNPLDDTVVVVEEEEALKRKSQIAAANMDGQDDIGPGGETSENYKAGNAQEATAEAKEAAQQEAAMEAKAREANEIKTAAGEEAIAAQLANIETAAGGPAGGRSNSGYGYGSRASLDPFATNPDIGPINPTALAYRAPILTPSMMLVDRNEDDNPEINAGVLNLDETNLAGGPISQTGTLSIDYGADGFGSLGPNGDFSSGGSQTGGALSSNGVPILVSVDGNTYTGTANGVKVFDLVLDPASGQYTFTQYEQLDHANGSDPNDVITLNFGVTATDGDGDAVSVNIQVNIADDAPTASGATETIDETDLGPIVEQGSITVNFGQDGPGNVQTTGDFAATGSVKGGTLATNGVPVTVTSTATGYTGTAGGAVVFTLTINPANGQYTYTQFKNLDHADASNPNDIITLTFGTKVTDYDGDTAPAPIVINIKDDAPIFQPPDNPPENPPENPPVVPGNPKPDSGLETVDETNLGPVVETGKLDADFGADVPGSYAFQAGSFASSGSLKNGALTHDGVPVVVTLNNGVYTGVAGNVTVFTLELNTTTGDYKFTLLDNFDHADATNPDDVITLDFGVIASDYEGDSAAGSIRINVKDDAPIANDDNNTYDSTFGVANGNVISGLNGGPGAADDLSTDGSNKVIKIAFGSNEVDVPATGTVSIDGEYGTLTIASDGTYTYKAFETGPMIEANAKEFTAGPALPDFDESQALDGVEQQSLGVAPGNLSVTGGETVTVTFVSEGAGYNNTMGLFTVGADGKLKAETVLIPNVNTANGPVSYTSTFATGALGFFVIADGATANNNYNGLDFSKGNLNFVYDFGLPTEREASVDDNGANVKLVFTSEGGVETVLNGPLYFTSDRGSMDNLNADGSVRVVSGIPGDDNTVLRIGFEDLPGLGDKDYNDVVFDVSITGKDCGCKDPAIKDVFTYTLQDGDGDTDKALLTLNGKDLTDDQPILTAPDAKTVDETDLNGGTITQNGNILVDFGHDGPGTLLPNGAFTSTGSKLNGALTHMGVPVVVSIVGDTYVGKAGNLTVFTLQVKLDGSYTFKLFDNLDHADGSNPNDDITLNFGVDAKDCDGDRAHTNIVIHVKDDAPVAHDDINTYDTNSGVATGNVITGLKGGAGAADILSTDAGNTVSKVSFGATTVDVPATGTATIEGDFGTLKISADGSYTYEKFTAGGLGLPVEKTFTDGPALPDFDEQESLDGVERQSLGVASGNLAVDKGDQIAVKFVSEGAAFGNTLGVFTVGADGKLNYETVLIKNGNETVGGQTFNYTAQGDAVSTGFFVVADGATANNGYPGIDFSKGTLNFVYDFGLAGERDAKITDDGSHLKLVYTSEGGVETVINGPLYFTSDRGDVSNLNADDSVRVVSGIPDGDNTTLRIGFEDLPGLGDQDYNDIVFDISITDKDCGCNDGGVKDVFTYTLKDYDGDASNATLTLNGKDMIDSNPIFATPGVETVDETNLKDGIVTETGKVAVNFGADGPGTVEGNGTFSSSGSQTAGILSSNGVAVQVTQVGNYFFGKAGNVTVFTLEVKADGNYSFKLFENLDHADGSNPDDEITLNFGLDAIDCDGDKAQTTLTVKVKDDAPVANDDSRMVEEGQTISGNVTGNDSPGQDNPATVTKIVFAGGTYNLPANGSAISIVGTQGTLSIDKTGAYTYVTKANADGVDNFTYTLKDNDGDTDTAVLSVTVTDMDTIPTIVHPGDKTVDETNLKDGVITETGALTADFKDDGPGTFLGNGSFTSGGSKLGGGLTSGGAQVVVSYDSGVYTGKAGGATVFTLTIAANGSYTFKLLEQLDHADGTNPNDEIELNFGVRAKDNDGDTADTTLTIHVKDDAPDANDDSANATEGQTISGNVTGNDVVGQDTPGSVTKVAFNGTVYDLTTGAKTIAGQYGTLTIDKTGAYSYTAKSNNPDGIDNFTYTLKDNDGDTDTAKLSICVTSIDDKPTITSAIETIDETNLASGAITETGSVSGNYFGDGPGAVSANGSFTSGGSRLNDKLTSNGVNVVVTKDGNTYTGMAGSVTVFTLAVASSGSYTFKLFEQLDHKDGTNPNDIIQLNFGIQAVDADSDVANGTITVNVKDDAPIANDDYNTSKTSPATGNVVTGLNGGPGAADTLSQDVANKVVKVSFGGTTVDVPTSGTATIMGANGTLKIAADGSYTYTADQGASSNGEEKTFVGGPALPDFDESEALDGVEQQSLGIAKGNLSVGEGDVLSVKFVSEGADYNNTLGVFTVDASGKLKAETVLIKNGNDSSAGKTYNYEIADGGQATGFFLVADGARVNNNYPGIDFSKGSLDFVYKYGTGSAREATINDNGGDVKLVYTSEGGAKTVINGPIYFTSDRGDVQHLNSDGNVRVVSGLPDQHDNTVLRVAFEDLPGLGDKDYNDIVFDISIKNNDCGCDNSDVFTYTLKDGDGDTDTATLTLDCVVSPPSVHINADDACVKEDGHVGVPVTASFTNGSGNETMTLTLAGVASGWKVTGWSDTGNGTFKLVLPQGQSNYNGSLDFKPPGNSDLDLNGLTFKASVYDPDTKATTVASDTANIIVDAVIDPFKFDGELTPSAAGGKIFVMTEWDYLQHSKLNLTNLTYKDNDGSESLKKIVFTIDNDMASTTFVSVREGDTYTKVGTKGMSGGDTTYTIDLSGMTYAQAKDYIENKLYLSNDGPSRLNGNYNLGVQVVMFEKNLGGVEKDYSDNQTSYQICLPVLFCISPLVVDLNKNGVELLSQENGVLFDISNDGVKDKTGWAAPSDGLLALDKNQDGVIGDRNELFGNTDNASNGFGNLSQYDLNKDGVIDTSDAIFKDLKVWQDVNSDGVSQSHELKSLADVKIESISLNAKDVGYEIAGNPVTHESSVTFTDGSQSDIVDAWFSYKDGALGGENGLSLSGTDGNDVLSGTFGSDALYGGSGADTFLFQTISEAVDVVKDFNAAEGDKLDLSGVLSQYDPVTDAINDFVFASQTTDGNTIVSVNETGTGGAAAAHIVAVLENANVNVSDLLNNGGIIA